jgi:hypothetical protein
LRLSQPLPIKNICFSNPVSNFHSHSQSPFIYYSQCDVCSSRGILRFHLLKMPNPCAGISFTFREFQIPMVEIYYPSLILTEREFLLHISTIVTEDCID